MREAHAYGLPMTVYRKRSTAQQLRWTYTCTGATDVIGKEQFVTMLPSYYFGHLPHVA